MQELRLADVPLSFVCRGPCIYIDSHAILDTKKVITRIEVNCQQVPQAQHERVRRKVLLLQLRRGAG